MKPRDGAYIAPPSTLQNPADHMNLPTGLTLRPEFRPQHDKRKESPSGSKAAPTKTSESGTTEAAPNQNGKAVFHATDVLIES